MSGFSLFPKISSGLEWIAGHSDAVIQFGWNIVAAVILLFVGKFVSRLISSGLEKLLLKRKVDRTIIQFFTALVRYITLAFAVVAALGRVGIETSSIIAVIGAAGLAIDSRYKDRFPTLPLAYYWSPCVHSAPEKWYKLGQSPERWKRYIFSPPPCSPPTAKKWSFQTVRSSLTISLTIPATLSAVSIW